MGGFRKQIYIIFFPGWGAKEYGGPFSNLLMEVPVPVWNNTNCEDQYVQQIWETNICAGGEFGKDSCQVRIAEFFYCRLFLLAIRKVCWSVKKVKKKKKLAPALKNLFLTPLPSSSTSPSPKYVPSFFLFLLFPFNYFLRLFLFNNRSFILFYYFIYLFIYLIGFFYSFYDCCWFYVFQKVFDDSFTHLSPTFTNLEFLNSNNNRKTSRLFSNFSARCLRFICWLCFSFIS